MSLVAAASSAATLAGPQQVAMLNSALYPRRMLDYEDFVILENANAGYNKIRGSKAQARTDEYVGYNAGHSGYGSSHSGYGSSHSGYGSSKVKKLECCELVVDPLALTALLGFLAAGTAFLNTVITMTIMMMDGRRRRRRQSEPEQRGRHGRPRPAEMPPLQKKPETLGAVLDDILMEGRKASLRMLMLDNLSLHEKGTLCHPACDS